MEIKFICYCDACGYRRFSETSEFADLVPHHVSPVGGGIPVMDTATKKIKQKPDISSLPKYKCPGCGRVIAVRRFNQKGPAGAK